MSLSSPLPSHRLSGRRGVRHSCQQVAKPRDQEGRRRGDGFVAALERSGNWIRDLNIWGGGASQHGMHGFRIMIRGAEGPPHPPGASECREETRRARLTWGSVGMGPSSHVDEYDGPDAPL